MSDKRCETDTRRGVIGVCRALAGRRAPLTVSQSGWWRPKWSHWAGSAVLEAGSVSCNSANADCMAARPERPELQQTDGAGERESEEGSAMKAGEVARPVLLKLSVLATVIYAVDIFGSYRGF